MAKRKVSRRRFIQSSLCGVAIGGGLSLPFFISSSDALAQSHIRPPGALKENEFDKACIRCGLCVQACPYDTLNLLDHNGSSKSGTPYFVARDIPCEMCTDIPCVQACPTGALNGALTDIHQAKMGVASLTHPHFCNSYIGAARCDSCYQACPIKDEAISLEMGRTAMGGMFTPVVHADACTGCGKCEQACIASKAAIRVIPEHV